MRKRHQVLAVPLLIVALLLASWGGQSHPGAPQVDDEEDPADIATALEPADLPDLGTEPPTKSLPGHRVTSMPGAAPRPVAVFHGAEEIEFECPSATGGAAPGMYGRSSFTLHGCPLRVYDTVAPVVGGGVIPGSTLTPDVGWLFGNVQMAVDEQDPDLAAFFSLHGNPANESRKENAREDVTHTSFMSQNAGLSWSDQPTGIGFPAKTAHGEWASGVMDRHGAVYPAFLWSNRTGEDAYESMVGVFWGGTPDEPSSVQSSYSRGQFLEARGEGHLIEMAHLSYLPPDGPPVENANGTQGPGETGEAAVVRNETDRIALVWLEQATDAHSSSTGMSSWIDMMWRSTDTPSKRGPVDRAATNWTFLDDDQLIGPCRGMSDPVVWDAQVYVACIVDRGYDTRTRALVGDVDIWRIDPRTGESHHVSFTGIHDAQHVRLTASPDGYFAVASSSVFAEHQVEVRVSMGWHATHWAQRALDISSFLHETLGGAPLRDAHVTGVALTEDDKTLFLTYKEWNDIDEPVVRSDFEMVRLKDYKKLVVAMSECTVPLAAAEFRMGEIFDSHQYEMWQDTPAIFNDRQDGLQYVRLADGRERVYMAINDYGAVQYAAMVPPTLQGDTSCNVGPAPVPIPAAALPQAVGTGTGAGTAVGSAVALVSLAMITYLLTVKRKSPLAAAAKDE